ncbi:hypothetical protein Hypma_005251 [Hypsizygus marmoreus]|uniref:F-box domain-containing protein n=1 Tax=Hypsizygus marmoreus TaxID=39966 RepID=A0A369K4L5_HYPMA|nr:hypothetical protein Hypma_005251 [Hypsizygus marmoreus]
MPWMRIEYAVAVIAIIISIVVVLLHTLPHYKLAMEIPNELVDCIVRSISMPDLLNLCRSSRTLRDNSIKYIYRDIKLMFEKG